MTRIESLATLMAEIIGGSDEISIQSEKTENQTIVKRNTTKKSKLKQLKQ